MNTSSAIGLYRNGIAAWGASQEWDGIGVQGVELQGVLGLIREEAPLFNENVLELTQ